MLKKIAVRDLRLGMHLHGFEGAWLDHPFWKTKFVLDDPADLRAAHASKVRECWIDASKGLDVAPANAQAQPPAPRPAAQPAPAPAPVPVPAPAPRTSLAEEVARASALCKRARPAVAAMFAEARLGKAVDPEHLLPLVHDITESVTRNAAAFVSLARLKSEDDYTYMHSVAVCALMVALGRQLGFDDARCREAGLAGLMHDLGKARVPVAVLNKPGKLTDEEFALVKRHSEWGAEMLAGTGVGEAALDVALHHHEKFDGSGYPHRLQGEGIALLARMGAVCDVYDAITSNRPYKAGWDPAESIARMAGWQGHFDPPVFQAFVKSLGIYPVGSLVKLQSQRLAVVSEQNPKSLVAPVVKLVFSLKSQLRLPPETLDLARSSDKIVGRESPAAWRLPGLDALWAGDALEAAR